MVPSVRDRLLTADGAALQLEDGELLETVIPPRLRAVLEEFAEAAQLGPRLTQGLGRRSDMGAAGHSVRIVPRPVQRDKRAYMRAWRKRRMADLAWALWFRRQDRERHGRWYCKPDNRRRHLAGQKRYRQALRADPARLEAEKAKARVRGRRYREKLRRDPARLATKRAYWRAYRARKRGARP
jgi:hypothetical protein